MLLWKQFHKAAKEQVNIEFVECGYWKDFRFWNGCVPFLHKFNNFFLLGLVYLVYGNDNRTLNFVELLYVLHVLVHFFNDIGYIEDDVCIADGCLHKVHHALLEHIVGLEDTWSVGEYNLVVLAVYNTHNAVPCCLGLGRNNGEFLSNKGIHKGGFAHVRIAYYVYKTSLVYLVHSVFHFHNCSGVLLK